MMSITGDPVTWYLSSLAESIRPLIGYVTIQRVKMA
jgi:hypothetical protein